MMQIENFSFSVSSPSANGSCEFRVQIALLSNQVYIWSTNLPDQKLENLVFAIPNHRLDEEGSVIFGDSQNNESLSMAKRLTKKLKIPVYLSLNLSDEFFLHPFEQSLLGGKFEEKIVHSIVQMMNK